MDPIHFTLIATIVESMVTLQADAQNLGKDLRVTAKAAARGGTPYETAQ